MPQSGNVKQIVNFSKGIITEASPLNFPENASIDEQNMVLDVDGSRFRRLGLDYEFQGRLGTTVPNTSSKITSSFSWKNVGEDSSLTIAAIQLGNSISFFLVTEQSLGSGYLDTIFIEGVGDNPYDYSVVNGDLVVTTGETRPISVTYTETEGFSFEYLDIRIRDLYGVQDNLDDSERPDILSSSHDYNLRNQGWPFEFTLGGPSTGDPVEDFYDDIQKYPSNSDHFQYGITPLKDNPEDEKFKPSLLETADTGSTRSPRGHFIIDPFNRGLSRKEQVLFTQSHGSTLTREFNPDVTCTETDDGGVCQNWIWTGGNPTLDLNVQVDNIFDIEITPAYNYSLTQDAVDNWFLTIQEDPQCNPFIGCPKIVVKFKIADTVSTIEIPDDKELGRFSCTASMGNRVFYSGIHSKLIDGDDESIRYNGAVFFSLVSAKRNDLEQCYQEADPTSRKVSDLVDSDGGVIFISEAKGIQKLIPLGSSLIVVASNGVWVIKGTDRGFTATEYIIDKISDIGSANKQSIVLVDTGIFYWSDSSIRYISQDQYGSYVVNNITETTIKSLVVNATNPVGFYDNIQNRVFWLHNNGRDELVFNLVLKAFTRNTYPEGKLIGYVDVPSYTISSYSEDVYVDSDLVFVDEDIITVSRELLDTIEYGMMYVTISDGKIFFSHQSSREFLDWEEFDYDSYIITGYDTTGDMISKKTTPYLFVYSKRTENGFRYDNDLNIVYKNPSACRVQTMWDWAGSSGSGKWGIKFDAYRLLRQYNPSGVTDQFNYGEDVVVTKNRMLGRGRTVSIKFSSETGKDMQLLGWGSVVTGAMVP